MSENSRPKICSKKEFDLYKSKLPQLMDPVQHERTPACLLQCVNWVLDVEECSINDDLQSNQGKNGGQNFSLMDPATTRLIASIVSIFIFKMLIFSFTYRETLWLVSKIVLLGITWTK